MVPSRGVKRWVMPTLRELKRRKDRETPKPIQRSTFIEWNYKAELYAFGQRLGEQFNPALLQQAFTQRSYIVQEEFRQQAVGIEQPETNLQDNKELIAKGEAVLAESLNLFLAAQLTRLPQPGQDAVRSFLMSEEVLANVASHLGCADLILSSVYSFNIKLFQTIFNFITISRNFLLVLLIWRIHSKLLSVHWPTLRMPNASLVLFEISWVHN